MEGRFQGLTNLENQRISRTRRGVQGFIKIVGLVLPPQIFVPQMCEEEIIIGSQRVKDYASNFLGIKGLIWDIT